MTSLSPHETVMVVEELNTDILFLGTGPAHANTDSVLNNTLVELYRFKVPHIANAVLSELVLLLIPKVSVRVPPHAQGSFPGGGKAALTNSRSLEVQDVGKV